MADRLYYRIVLKRPNGDLSKFRFPHVWDGEAARPSTVTPSVPSTLLLESGDALLLESGDEILLET